VGGIHDSWRLTPAAGGQYLQAPDRVVITRVRRTGVASQRESVSNIAVVAEAGTHAPAALPWVVFSCDGGRYGVLLDRVCEILAPRPFTRLPGAGPEVCGLVGVRGRVVTVFDMGAVLGLRSAAPLPDHRMLLMDLGPRRIGAVVEDIVDIAPAHVEPEAGEAGIVGRGRMQDAEFTALDPHVLLGRLLPG
jgi:purine-binding chemotaxis protein CheW